MTRKPYSMRKRDERSEIRAAGDYLLSILGTDSAVLKSRYYNLDPRALADAIWPFWTSLPVEVRGEDADDVMMQLVDEGHLLVEFAAMQLEDLGVVTITNLGYGYLPDGEAELRFELTERGRRFISDGDTFGYRSCITKFYVSQVSEVILDSLRVAAATPSPTLTLRQLMEDAPLVTDEWGNEYPGGTNTNAWAFEVCLWHHARSKPIEPVIADEAHRQAWEEHVGKEDLPPRTDLKSQRLLWDVPFRLGASELEELELHIGWFEEE